MNGTDWVANVIQVVAILIPVGGGIYHVLQTIWKTQTMIRKLNRNYLRMRKRQREGHQDITLIKDVLRIKRRDKAVKRPDSDIPPPHPAPS
jgi:hypothetical protein